MYKHYGVAFVILPSTILDSYLCDGFCGGDVSKCHLARRQVAMWVGHLSPRSPEGSAMSGRGNRFDLCRDFVGGQRHWLSGSDLFPLGWMDREFQPEPGQVDDYK